MAETDASGTGARDRLARASGSISAGAGSTAAREGGGRITAHSAVLTGIFVILLLYTLQVARILLLPIVIALFANLALTPVVRWMRSKLGLPQPASAAILVILLWIGSIGALAGLSESAATWVSRMPEFVGVIEYRLAGVKESMRAVSEATESVEEMTRMDGKPAPAPVDDGDSWVGLALTGAQGVLVAWVLILTLLLFLLSSGDRFLRKIIGLMPGGESRGAVQVLRDTESEISTYLLTITMINVVLGVAVGVAMAALGMPNPILWGVVAGALNFAPYLGPLVAFSVLSVVALLSFDDLAYAAWVPLVFAFLTATEGLLITPYIIGRRMLLSPVAVLLALLVWSWIWGVPGALLAVPILVATKLACERVERLQPFARLLER
jgi:predicted PurR-regulated permease PerM